MCAHPGALGLATLGAVSFFILGSVRFFRPEAAPA